MPAALAWTRTTPLGRATPATCPTHAANLERRITFDRTPNSSRGVAVPAHMVDPDRPNRASGRGLLSAPRVQVLTDLRRALSWKHFPCVGNYFGTSALENQRGMRRRGQGCVWRREPLDAHCTRPGNRLRNDPWIHRHARCGDAARGLACALLCVRCASGNCKPRPEQ